MVIICKHNNIFKKRRSVIEYKFIVRFMFLMKFLSIVIKTQN